MDEIGFIPIWFEEEKQLKMTSFTDDKTFVKRIVQV